MEAGGEDVQKVTVGEEKHQEGSSSTNQENQEDHDDLNIKEEQLWSSQAEDQLLDLQETETTKFTFSLVSVKTEDDEEKPQLSQLHSRDSVGEPEPRLEEDDKMTDSSETDVSDGDWEETSKTQSRLNPINKIPTAETCEDDDEKPFGCSECGRRFNHSWNLKQHLRIHTGEKPFSCSECSKTFSRNTNLKAHLRIHSGEKRFSCSVCHKRFTWNHHLKTHRCVSKSADCDGSRPARNSSDPTRNKDEKPLSCSECGRRFTHSWNLKQHLRTHTGEKPFSCSECSKTFSRNTNLKAHLRIHSGEKRFSCSSCHKRFTWNHHLKTHRCVSKSADCDGSRPARNSSDPKGNKDEKPHSCLECGRRFRHGSDLSRHLRSHTGEKTFSCSECSRGFSDKSTLTNHLRTHTGQKPFGCSVCGRNFKHSVSLTQHLKTHTGEKPFGCSECGKTFSRSTNLNAHLRIHRGEKRFSCRFCDRRFTRKHHMIDHERMCTSVSRGRPKPDRKRTLMPRPNSHRLVVLVKDVGLDSAVVGTQQPASCLRPPHTEITSN
uniref:C2H2-type domain-containing protein n=1 Tax=Amphiprion percula TaxID=161767 RepID=A0A3P8RRD1_AMPPE